MPIVFSREAEEDSIPPEVKATLQAVRMYGETAEKVRALFLALGQSEPMAVNLDYTALMLHTVHNYYKLYREYGWSDAQIHELDKTLETAYAIFFTKG